MRPWIAAPRSGPNGVACGVDDGLVMSRGATGVRWARPAQVNGQFALRLAAFEALAQEVAAETMATPIARIETLGAYVCRSVKGTAGSPSEHASGNAVDVSAFVLKDGRRITVARHFVRAGAATTTPSERFLRRLTEKLRQQGTFGTVLTPDYDARHANHFHLDGRRWFGGWF